MQLFGIVQDLCDIVSGDRQEGVRQEGVRHQSVKISSFLAESSFAVQVLRGKGKYAKLIRW